jgi:hypothetical protein
VTSEAPPTTPSLGERAVRVLRLTWVPLVASLTSLVLSISSIIISTRDPSVRLLLPDQIRFVQGEGLGFAYAYLQPTFVSTGENDRVEVFRDMRLEVTPLAGGEEAATFGWDEVGRLVFDPADDSLTYQYLADAVPLLVAPDSAENPLALFQGPRGWFLEPGGYRIELVADRVVASADLRASFEITLTESDVDFLNDADGGQFLTLTIAEGG